MGQSGEGEVVRASQGRSVIWSDAVNLGVLEELQAGWVFDAVVSSFYAERGLYNSKGGVIGDNDDIRIPCKADFLHRC